MHDALDWTWFALFLLIVGVRKYHEHRVGRRTSMRGIPALELTLMLLWAVAAGVLPLIWLFSPWLDGFGWSFEIPVAVRIAGAVMFAVAIWLLHASHRDLGRYWSPTVEFQPDHQLVTDGVYRIFRHPMYMAHVLWGIAQLLLVPNMLAGPLALVIMLLVLMIRIPREERAMREHFGVETPDPGGPSAL